MLNIGDQIRPRGAINYGTLSFFCADSQNNTYLASCDHVMKTSSTPDNGPWKIYYPQNASYRKKIALFKGSSLVNKELSFADFSIAETLVPIDKTLKLPSPLPGSGIETFTGVDSVHFGKEVLIWGSTTQTYINGVILTPDNGYKNTWPHTKYSPIAYEAQFSIALISEYIPQIGDSGGYITYKNGNLVGIIAALSGEVLESGINVIHCVPVKQCLDKLGLKLLTNLEGEIEEIL